MSAAGSAASALRAVGLDPVAVGRLLAAAMAEDLGDRGDITSAATVPVDAVLCVRYVTREAGTVAGLPLLAALVEQFGGREARFQALARDGDRVVAGQALAQVQAPARAVLALERTSLNLLGHLCGVATITRAWADALADTPTRVRDTRKTMPLLRALQKYAVRCGGGVNHRGGLHDAVLIKDNHVAAAGGVGAALAAALAAHPAGDVVVQVEVDDLGQLAEALEYRPAQVLLDNFDPATAELAVALIRAHAPHTVVEASGGLTLEQARTMAATGVDFLAVGALTHSARILDVGLDVINSLESLREEG